jgi:mono/diheme cytochrome c family protein
VNKFLLTFIVLSILPLLAQAQSAKPAEPKGDAAKGRQIFVTDGCYECHGREGQGTAAGLVLGPSPTPFSKFIAYVRKPTAQMPPYTAKVISDAELRDIYAFLDSLPEPKPAKNIPLLTH